MNQLQLNTNPETCPVIHGIRLIDGKYKPMIIHILLDRNMRFGQLKSTIAIVTQKVLTQQLRELEHDGIVVRTVTQDKVLNVTYSLSALGLALLPVLNALGQWGEKHKTSIKID